MILSTSCSSLLSTANCLPSGLQATIPTFTCFVRKKSSVFAQNVFCQFSPHTVPQSLQNQPSKCMPENQNILPPLIFLFLFTIKLLMQTSEMTSRPLLVRKFPSGENTMPFGVELNPKLSLPRHTLYSWTPVSALKLSTSKSSSTSVVIFRPARAWQ